MRELKFRAWHEADECWYNPRFIEMNLLGQAILSHGIEQFEIIPASAVEQYTGLKDKNGREIYEGDIVFFFTEHYDNATGGYDGEDEHNATVEWFDNGFAFMDKLPYDPNIECEVIGNIHENKELLGD